MTVAHAYAHCCHRAGVVLGWGLMGTALGTASGSLAAITLAIQQKAGLIFGAAAGGVALPLFKASADTPNPFRTCAAAAAGLVLGTAAGYLTLHFSDNSPSLRTFTQLTFLTASFGIPTLLTIRGISSRLRPPARSNANYMHLEETHA